MTNGFLPDDILDRLALEAIAQPTPTDDEASPPPVRLRVILISTAEEVMDAIYELHQKKFAEVRSWSPLQKIPDSDEVISIHTRTGQAQSDR